MAPPSSTASFSDAPTNKNMLKMAMIILWMLIINKADIRVTSSKYIHLLPHHPLSLSDYTFAELVFRGSDMVNIVSLIVIMAIMIELVCNVSDDARRPINLYYQTCTLAIMVSTMALCLLRMIIGLHSESKLSEILFTSLLLMLAAGIGWFFWSFLHPVKKKAFVVSP